MEIALKFLGMPSTKYESGRGVWQTKTSMSSSTLQSHSYNRFIRSKHSGSSLYEKTFGFSNSPLKRSTGIMKTKRRSLEVSRCSSLEQREQYRRLIAQYRMSSLQESVKSSGFQGFTDHKNVTKQNSTVIDLTGRTSPDNESKTSAVIREAFKKINDQNTTKESNVYSNQAKTYDLPKPALKETSTVSLKDFVSPYLSENFIPNLLKTYGRRERERQMQKQREETKARLNREKREAKEALLAEILHEKLQVVEKEIEIPKLPEITEEMSDVISAALRPVPPYEVLSEAFNISITREHMSTLFGLNWLNDEIVNFYMELVVQRSKDCPDLPSIHAMNTFFYPRLSKNGYNSVRRWTKKVDIFSKDMVLYPIHLGVHWCLAVIDFTKKEIRYFDSMGGDNVECLETLRDYLASEHQNKKGSDFDLSSWKYFSVKDIPQQMNGSDCGVFTCKFAEYVSLQKDFTFDQSNMPYFRRAMVWEILNKKLLR